MEKRCILVILALVVCLGLGMTAYGAEIPEGENTGDSSLSYLKVIPGDLSPEFAPEILEYSVTVKPNHTKLAVSAKPTVESSKFVVSNTYLEVGTNVITIKVTAENGSLTTYTLNVVRPEGGSGVTEAEGTPAPDTTAPATDAPQVEEEKGNIPVWAFFLAGLAIGGIVLAIAANSAVKQFKAMEEEAFEEEEDYEEPVMDDVFAMLENGSDDVFEFLDEELDEKPDEILDEAVEETIEEDSEKIPEEDEFEFFDL